MLGVKLYHNNDTVNYLIDVNFIQDGFPKIVFVFENIDYEPLKSDIYRMSCLPEYIDCEYDDNEKEICIYFDVPKEYKADFELFTKGLYSGFSNKYKDLLINEYGDGSGVGVSDKTGLPNISLFDAINPSEDKKLLMAKQLGVKVSDIIEVLDPPNLKEEEFKKINELIR